MLRVLIRDIPVISSRRYLGTASHSKSNATFPTPLCQIRETLINKKIAAFFRYPSVSAGSGT